MFEGLSSGKGWGGEGASCDLGHLSGWLTVLRPVHKAHANPPAASWSWLATLSLASDFVVSGSPLSHLSPSHGPFFIRLPLCAFLDATILVAFVFFPLSGVLCASLALQVLR